jgi:Zn-finger nucleic acid-binding protein
VGVDFQHPSCPTCGSELTRTVTGDLATWVCPNGHGAGLTVTQEYKHVQDDEIHRAWEAAKTAPPGPRKCPICARAMAVVNLDYTSDERPEVSADNKLGTEALDVCTEDELIWFDPGEFEALPADLPKPEPSADELAKIASIRQAFGDQIVAAAHQRDDATLTEHLYRHLSRHPFVVAVAQRHRWL